MKLANIFASPPPLIIDCGIHGDQQIEIHLRRWTGADRSAVVDAIQTGSNEALERAIEPLIVGWRGIVNEDGSPIPFTRHENGRDVSNLPLVLGALPFRVQVQVLLGVASFIGVPGVDVAAALEQLDRAGAGRVETDPTSPPGASTPGGASPNS